MNSLPSRGLIVRAPYAGLIVDDKKLWEMRSKKTKIRGRIAIIEAGSGLIIGEAVILTCLMPSTVSELKEFSFLHRVENKKLLAKWCVPWVLKNTKRYENPIPYNHPPGAVVWVDLTKPGVINPPMADSEGVHDD